MWNYVLRRLMVMVPVLGVMMVLSFIISRNTPGDPVLMALGGPESTAEGSDRISRQANYRRVSAELGLDKPTFYVELGALSSPDTLHRIVNLSSCAAFSELCHRTGNPEAVNQFHQQSLAFSDHAYALKSNAENQYVCDEIRATSTLLVQSPTVDEIAYNVDRIDSLLKMDSTATSFLLTPWNQVLNAFEGMQQNATPWKSYVPVLRFHGFDNQFHHWITRYFQLEWGRSFNSKRPVWNEITAALPWSLLLGGMAYLLSFFLAIVIGLAAVRYHGCWQDNLSTILLFLAHSVPSFVIAMLAITFFCNPQYFYWFPVSGVSSDGSDTWPWAYRLVDHLYHLVLPTLVFTVHGVASLSRQLRGSMLENMQSDFIRTARAKGMTENIVLRRHALGNSLPPLINAVTHSLPGILMGSVFIETVFSLPGMGGLVVNAMHTGDHPVVVGVFSLVAVATIFSNLVADILYALTDPRVSFSKSR